MLQIFILGAVLIWHGHYWPWIIVGVMEMWCVFWKAQNVSPSDDDYDFYAEHFPRNMLITIACYLGWWLLIVGLHRYWS